LGRKAYRAMVRSKGRGTYKAKRRREAGFDKKCSGKLGEHRGIYFLRKVAMKRRSNYKNCEEDAK
jgi:hypothetical protein